MSDVSSQPTRPTQISEYAEVCLRALEEKRLGTKISLGGAFGLLHYLDYRATHDVDAWWVENTTSQEKKQVTEAIVAALSQYGQARVRLFGDVTSIELDTTERKGVFSFQIADRSAQLQPSVPAGWANVLLDSLPDLIASKMNALIQRGAPRDFRDIHAICISNLATPMTCWQLWRQRQELAGDEANIALAMIAIRGHLERIELYRPLDAIADLGQREQARQLRQWYREVFLHERLA